MSYETYHRGKTVLVIIIINMGAGSSSGYRIIIKIACHDVSKYTKNTFGYLVRTNKRLKVGRQDSQTHEKQALLEEIIHSNIIVI